MNNSRFFSLILLLLVNLNMSAQQKKHDSIDIGIDFMSRYIFRGTDVGGASPSMQPKMQYMNGKFTAGLWGAYATNKTGIQETDVYLSYAITDKIGVTITDYFFPTDDGNYQYFDYDKLTTGHLFEASISFSGTKNVPLSFLLATNFYGADAIRLDSNGTRKDIQYSSYAEVGYNFSKLHAFIGLNLTEPNENLGETGFYGNNFGIVNLGFTTTKKLTITKSFTLPLSFSLITNPQAEKIFFVFGISL